VKCQLHRETARCCGHRAFAGEINTKPYQGPTLVNRYRMYPSADLNGVTIPYLISSGQAMDQMDALAKRDLLTGLSYEWTDMAYQQQEAANTKVEIPGVFEFRGDTTLLVFGLSVLVAFLVLAALYESWLLPLAIVLIVPMCMLCAVTLPRPEHLQSDRAGSARRACDEERDSDRRVCEAEACIWEAATGSGH
jgi:hypothetical protein